MALCKVLVVEPDEMIRDTIYEILSMLDCTYEAADSLAHARKILSGKNEYDLVLSSFNMPSLPGAKPRLQNAEHFMLALRKARAKNMPKVIMLIENRPNVCDEDKTRWAFAMRDLGVSDVVCKPLVDEGRTLDRVIKKVMSILDTAPDDGPIRPKHKHVPQDEDGIDEWLTVTQAAELLMHDVLGLELTKARSRISTAAGRKEFQFSGDRKDRRIEPNSFASWRLRQRDRDLDDEDKA